MAARCSPSAGGGSTAPRIEIFVRAKRSGTADAWNSSTAVCAGGISSNAHTAEIEVRTVPPTPSYPIDASLNGGGGQSVAAQLNLGSTTDSDGKVHGTLISSDKVESATVVAGSSSVTIAFDWNVNPVWTLSPEPLGSTNSSSLTLTHHGEAVNGHSIQFLIDRAQIVNGETGSVDDTNDATEISGVAHFDPDSAITDGGGDATTTLEITGDENRYAVELGLIASDATVHDAAEYHPNTQVNGHPHQTRLVALADLGVQSSDPDIELFGQAPTLTTPMLGTSPMDGAKVQPGQLVTFKLACLDQDSVTPTGQPKKISPLRTGAKYAVKIELTNAVFEDTGETVLDLAETQVTTVAGNHPTNGKMASQISLDNVKIRVNSGWTGGPNNPVKVTVTVTDKTDFSLAGFSGTVVDKPKSFPLKWTKATAADYPDNQTEFKQETLANGSLRVFYRYGDDHNGVGNPAANYEGITVNEEFGDSMSNLMADWLTAATRMTHPDWDDARWAKDLFADTGFNVTFVIGPDDTTTDTHGANYSLLNTARQKLKPDFQNNDLYCDQHQTFVCPPPATILGRYVIRRRQNPSTNQSSVTKFPDTAP